MASKNKKKDNKEINKKIVLSLLLFNPSISMATGFGIFWMYQLLFHNVWGSMIMGGYVTAIMMMIVSQKELE